MHETQVNWRVEYIFIFKKKLKATQKGVFNKYKCVNVTEIMQLKS